MEDENHTGKNTSDLLESKRHGKIRNKYEGINESRKNRSTINRKYSERYSRKIFTKRTIFLIIKYIFLNILIHMQYILSFFLYFGIFFKAPTS